MPYAVTPQGVGKSPALRAVDDGWPLEGGETFLFEGDASGLVLGENEQSLRAPTPAELLEQAKRAKLAELQAAFERYRDGGFDHGGHRYKSNAAAQQALTGRAARITAGRAVTFPMPYLDADDQPTSLANAEAVYALGDALDAHIDGAIQRHGALIAQVNAATTPAQLDAVVKPPEWA